MAIRAASRPAIILSDDRDLDREMRSAHYLYHRLLDFEDRHQLHLDETAERVAPGIVRVARIISRLMLRARRRARTTPGQWSPDPRLALLATLRDLLRDLRAKRNASDEWKAALKWADEVEEGAPERGGIRRKPTETDEQFSERKAKRRTKLTRREAWRKVLYDAHVADGATEQSRVYWGTWNALLKSVDQARKSVMMARKAGMPAEWRRPRWDDPCGIAADAGGFRIVERGTGVVASKSGSEVGNPWWVIEQRLSSGWVRYRAKIGNWHEIPEDTELRTCRLVREKDGRSWRYRVSICVGGMPAERTFSVGWSDNKKGKRELLDGHGMVALDWGHREHGHPGEHVGLRVFTWLGDDGKKGTILLPTECRELLDRIDAAKSRLDKAFVARAATLKIAARNRFGYRKALLRSGVVTDEEDAWLRWEARYEKRMDHWRRRIVDLRRETYTMSIRMLRQRYGTFAIEDETITRHRALDIEEMTRGRKRQNRELSARYAFTQMCERFGATLHPVPSRNTTRECPRDGELGENTSELLIVCPCCGIAEDKDHRACCVILARAQEALAKQAAE